MTFAPAGIATESSRADRFDPPVAHEDDLIADDSAVGHVDETSGADGADSGFGTLDSAGERATASDSASQPRTHISMRAHSSQVSPWVRLQPDC